MKYKTTLFTWSLITIIFLVTNYIGLSFANRIRFGALYDWNGQTGEWWRVITYGFLHLNTRHFVLNLLVGFIMLLYFENKTNSRIALIVFLSGIIGGGIGFLIFNEMPRVLTVGASAGVWALFGASLSLMLTKKVINLFEIAIIIVATLFLIEDTVAATNVNYISHYTGYLSGYIAIILIEVIKKRSYIFYTRGVT